MIFTSVCYLGDHLLLWPVASWYYKTHNEKIHWVLSKNFYLYPKICNLLAVQDFTEKISLVDVGTDAWIRKDWEFSPSLFGINGNYMNFGFHRMPTEYLSRYYADMYNLDYDKTFVPKLIEFDDVEPVDVVSIDITDLYRPGLQQMKQSRPHNTTILNFDTEYERNILIGAKANRRILSTSSFAIFMDMLNKPCEIYGSNQFHKEWFYRNDFHSINLY